MTMGREKGVVEGPATSELKRSLSLLHVCLDHRAKNRISIRPSLPGREPSRELSSWLSGQPTSVSHGTGAARAAWFKCGYQQYNINDCAQVYTA